jgi:hypothetical protein
VDGRSNPELVVVVGMNDPTAVAMMWREYPEGKLFARKPQKGTWRPLYVFRLNYHKATRFLEEIEPFLLVKREQVKVARAFLAHRARDHRGKNGVVGSTTSCNGRCGRLLAKLKELKRTDHQGVNSVNLGELREYRAKPEDVAEDAAIIAAKLQSLWEGVETSGEGAIPNKPDSAPEREIVQEEYAKAA